MRCPCGKELINNICPKCKSTFDGKRFFYKKQEEREGEMARRSSKKSRNKEDYIECPNCEAFIRKDRINKGYPFDDLYCPVCDEELPDNILDGKNDENE
ncbi:MAG: hypothetical protein JSW62_04740 [Thermoplasmatales archaeon]|nr:MAG: hypothetical protein JSW62_04740 [Thermoplasmatales archaeon]